MPRVHKAVFSEELTAGPFQGITVIVEVVLKSRPLLTHFKKKKNFLKSNFILVSIRPTRLPNQKESYLCFQVVLL